MAKLWNVSIPVTGQIDCVVSANTKLEAIDRAMSCEYGGVDGESDFESDAKEMQWELHKCITEGNVTNAMLNSIDVSECK